MSETTHDLTLLRMHIEEDRWVDDIIKHTYRVGIDLANIGLAPISSAITK